MQLEQSSVVSLSFFRLEEDRLEAGAAGLLSDPEAGRSAGHAARVASHVAGGPLEA